MIENDPLLHFFHKISFHPEEIIQITIGEKYLACELKDGRLGVCATLGQVFPDDYSFNKTPDLSWICDRILLNAWFNAKLNNSRSYPEDKDIFDFLSFEKYKNIVMVGYFGSLVRKFNSAGISLTIFDLVEDMPDLKPMAEQEIYIGKADALILTSTSISNGTFPKLVEASGKHTEVFLLGPSTILDPDLYEYPNVSKIFGMIFGNSAPEVCQMIKNGHGTPSFSKFGQKVYL